MSIKLFHRCLLCVGLTLVGGTAWSQVANPTACEQMPQCVLVTQFEDGHLEVNRNEVHGSATRTPVLFFYWTGSSAGRLQIEMKDPSASPFADGATVVDLTFDAAVQRRVKTVSQSESFPYNVVNAATGVVLDPVIVIDP